MATKESINKNQWFKSFISIGMVKEKLYGLIIVIQSIIKNLFGKEVSEFDTQLGRSLKAIRGVSMELEEIDTRFSNFIDWSVLNDFRSEDELVMLNKKRYKGQLETDLSIALQDICNDYSVLWRALDTLRIYFIYSDNIDIKEGIAKNQKLIERRLKLIHPKALTCTLRHGSYCNHSIGFLMQSELIEKFITKSYNVGEM